MSGINFSRGGDCHITCAWVMAHLFLDIRNLEWQTPYLDMVLITPHRKNTSDHASHTRHSRATLGLKSKASAGWKRAIGMGLDGCGMVGHVFAKCGISEIFLPRDTSLNHAERNFFAF